MAAARGIELQAIDRERLTFYWRDQICLSSVSVVVCACGKNIAFPRKINIIALYQETTMKNI